MKTINDYADEVAEVTLQLMDDTTDWVIADHPSFHSENFDAIHANVLKLAIEKMFLQIKHD